MLRLSSTEYWLLGSLTKLPGLDACDSNCLNATPNACYPLFCMDSHGWLMLTGEHVSGVMAKLGGVDLREEAFPVGSIAQTSLARINGIIVHQEINGLTEYSILCDNASIDYVWTALIDAVRWPGWAGECGGLIWGRKRHRRRTMPQRRGSVLILCSVRCRSNNYKMET